MNIAGIPPNFLCGAFILLCCGVATKSFQTLVNFLVIVFSIISILMIV